MASVPQPPSVARFLAQLGAGARDVLRDRHAAAGITLPDDSELAAAVEAREAAELAKLADSAPDNRRNRRAVRAVERRSAREPLAAPDTLALKAKAARERSEDRRYREKLARRAADWVGPPVSKRVKTDRKGREWRLIPQAVWNMAKDVVSDTSGRAWRYWARQVRNKAALGAIRRAALLPIDGSNGQTRRNWSDECARRIAALGLALVALAKHTARKGPWSLIVRGIPVAALRWLLGYPVSQAVRGEAQREAAAKLPHWNTLIGRHRGRDSDRERGTLGYLRCLEESGLISTQQAYTDPAPWEQSDVIVRPGMPGRRFNMNRYWLTADGHSTRNRERKPELIELNREGWASLDEHPRRHRSRVLYTRKPRENAVPAAPS